MSQDQRTRHSQRQRKFAPLSRIVDKDQQQLRLQNKIDALESDYYESPNKLAEDEHSDEFDANEEDDDDRRGRKKVQSNNPKKKIKRKKIPKKVKISYQVRKNLNLKKLLKEDSNNNQVSVFPNFINVRATQDEKPRRKYCSVCLIPARYTCPRCFQSYCSLKCHLDHKDISCLRTDF